MPQQKKIIEDDFVPDSDDFYDYDSAIKAGAKPDKTGHWPSEFKKPGHPNEIVGGFNTRTGLPEQGHQLITNPDELMKLGWEPKTALELSRKYANQQEDDFTPDDNSSTIKQVDENEPDTFMGGFKKSLTSGDALGAGLEGAGGYLKGAILDIPETLIGQIKSIHDTFAPQNVMRKFMNPLGNIKESGEEVRNFTNQLASTFENAGNEPEAFGRMMGQMTGQPLATAGLIKGAPPVMRGIGRGVEGTGRVMKNYAPISGMVPKIMEPRILRSVERMIGRGVEKVGNRMRVPRSNNSNIITGENLAEYKPNIPTGRPLRNYQSSEPMDFPKAIISGEDLPDYMMEYQPPPSGNMYGRRYFGENEPLPFEKTTITNEDLPNLGNRAANISGYRPNITPQSLQNLMEIEPLDFPKSIISNSDLADYMLGNKSPIRPMPSRNISLEGNNPMPFEKSIITNEDYANLGREAASTSGYKPSKINKFFQDIELTNEKGVPSQVRIHSPLTEGQSILPKQKIKLTINRDGTFTNTETGEMFNSRGEPLQSGMDRNSSFFTRNRR